MRVALIFAVCAGLGVAQRTPAPPPKADARIEGTVLSSAGKAPLRRARVTINPLDPGRTLRPGVYLVRLTQRGQSLTSRVSLVR